MASRIDVSKVDLRDKLSTAAKRKNAKPACEFETTEQTETKEGFHLNVKSFDRIQTADQALQKAGIDTAVWEPVKVTANSWEVVVRDSDNNILTKPLWQVKVECRRRVSKAMESACAVLASRIVGGKFKLAPIKYKTAKVRPSVLELSMTDHHFGKLGWAPEVGHDYDLKIAERYFENGVNRSIDRAIGCDIAEIILPLGNDYYHFETRSGTTEAGTPVDCDGRWAKVYQVGIESMLNAVERCRQVAPVRVVWIPGNHDYVSSYWLCQVIKQAFASSKNVTVDVRPVGRKYHQFGKCLIGWCHGKDEKAARLPGLMAVEKPEDWAKSTACREWHIGHLHQSKSLHWMGTHESDGVTVRVLPSLAGTDAWHFANGFCMSRHATQCHVYDYEYGLTAIYQVPVEEVAR
jgi:hypothetical protein